MRPTLCVALALGLLGCSSDSDSPPGIPQGASVMIDYLQDGVALLTPGLNRFDALLPFVVNPGAPGTTGIQFDLDTSPSAPPYSYTFTITLDGDGDGSDETTLTGRCELTGDPATAGEGFGGVVDLSGVSVGGLGTFSGTVTFTLTDLGTQISGFGTFDEVVIGNTTNVLVSPADPVYLNVATGAANSMPNACAYSLDGTVEVEVAGPSGFLSSLWNFLPTQRSVSTTQMIYVDPDTTQTELPDASFEIPCGGGSIQDWAGVFLQTWSCVPPEYGGAELTITVTGANTIHIVDEDPPGSGEFHAYNATADAGRPHIVRGYFIAGPPGNTYREDFTWTLNPDGNGFSQVSAYVYVEGPSLGTGGLCAASMQRSP